MPSVIFKIKLDSFAINVIILGFIHWNINFEVGKNIKGIPKPSTNKTYNEIYKQWGVNELMSFGRKGFLEKIWMIRKTYWKKNFFFAVDCLNWR